MGHSVKNVIMSLARKLLLSIGFLGMLVPNQPCVAEVQRVGPLEVVPAIRQSPEWRNFKILVWQYKTSALEDIKLYRQAGLGGFHIDRGAGQDKAVEFSIRESFPYYVDHLADKGFLHLTGENVRAVKDKHNLTIRPHSLAYPPTMARMKEHIFQNIETTKKGFVLAYAFDDEISLGTFVTPCDVDIHPESLTWFREWLHHKYGSVDRLNKQWGTSFNDFEGVVPEGFEQIRKSAIKPPLSQWNLSPWMDFRHFMDFQFAAVLAELVRFANSIDPLRPAGFVGGQAPSPWGGYDYSMLSRAVQWIEAYDIHGTNEILRSFWNLERRPHVQTFFSTKNPKLDSWFLWYYVLHGDQAVIAWPEGWFRVDGYEIAPHIIANEGSFKEIQGKVNEQIVNPLTIFDPDPIGIYYSQPSVQAGWVMDAITHGKTWIKRSSSLDNQNQTRGVLRKVWCKTLEDLGFQYDFISYLDVREGLVDLGKRFNVIILPRTICLSDREVWALKRFVVEGGVLIADTLCGIMDEHGKGRPKGALDHLFGITRDESAGYMNGRGLTEIDGEKYEQPFLKRFSFYRGAYRYKDIVVFERGTRHSPGADGVKINSNPELPYTPSVLIKNRSGKGQSIYLNLSPIEYWAPSKRFSSYGDTWRSIVNDILSQAGVKPRVSVYENGTSVNMIESLHWKNGDRHYLGLVKNPTEQKELATISQSPIQQGITGREVEIQMEFNRDDLVRLINLRTNRQFGTGRVFRDQFKPWEGNLYEVIYPEAHASK